MSRKRAHRHIGSDFEDFLIEDGRLHESTARAVKRVLASQVARASKADRRNGKRGRVCQTAAG